MKFYRYFTPKNDVFSEISELDITSRARYNEVKKYLPNHYTYDYILRRMDTEKKLYDMFISKGGKPEKSHPYYLTLGCCNQWFFGERYHWGSMVFSDDEFDPNTISFTYGDSIPTFMDEFNDGKEYRKYLYTVDEIPHIIHKYGYPQEWNPLGKLGPENYIEVQVWSDHPIIDFRPRSHTKEGWILFGIPSIALRMIYAKGLNADNFLKWEECIEIVKSSVYWSWFCSYIQEVNTDIFQSNPIHGFLHGYKCAILALVLASLKNLDEIQTKTLVLSALYHDIGRKHNRKGFSHAQIGADIVMTYINNREHIQLEDLVNAIRFHDASEAFDDQGILQYLKDCDTLDYLRLGFGEFEFNYLRSVEAKRLLLFALELNMYAYTNPDLILHLTNKEKSNEN